LGYRREELEANKAVVFRFYDPFEDRPVVDLARPEFVASGIVGDVDVTNDIDMLTKAPDYVTVHDPVVIEIE